VNEFNAKYASKVVEEYLKEKIEPVVEENVRAARIRDLEKKLEIAVEALKFYADKNKWLVNYKENGLIQAEEILNFMEADCGEIASQALLAIQGKQ